MKPGKMNSDASSSPAKGGRPTKFTPQIAHKVCLLAQKGLIDREICQCLDIAESTLNEWKKLPEFSKSLKEAKKVVDEQVKSSLLSRALGFEYVEKHEGIGPGGSFSKIITKQAIPDVTACIFWLKNRCPDKWCDKPDPSKNGAITSIAELFATRWPEEQKRLAAGEDPGVVLFGRERVDNAPS